MNNFSVAYETARSNGCTLSDVVTTPKAVKKNVEC